jgi:hypothetical protein
MIERLFNEYNYTIADNFEFFKDIIQFGEMNGEIFSLILRNITIDDELSNKIGGYCLLFNKSEYFKIIDKEYDIKIDNNLMLDLFTGIVDIELIKYCLLKSINVDIDTLNYVLMVACRGCDIDIIKLLIEMGGDISHSFYISNESAINVSCMYNNVDVLNYILQQTPTLIKQINVTTYEIIVECGYMEIFTILLKYSNIISKKSLKYMKSVCNTYGRYEMIEKINMVLK